MNKQIGLFLNGKWYNLITELKMTVEYAKGSTSEQKLKTQIAFLEKEGCEKIYTDVTSSIKDDRKNLNGILKCMGKGDTILTYKNDGVFRSPKNMVEFIDRFNEEGLRFKSMGEPEFGTTSTTAKK